MIKTINKIKEGILDFRLGDALAELDEIINAHVDWGLGDELNSLADNYKLMLSSMSQGLTDPMLDENYLRLLRESYRLYSKVKWNVRKMQNQSFGTIYGATLNIDVDTCCTKLENFFADDILGQDSKEQHQQYTNEVFNVLINQSLWNDETAQKMEQMLLSPTVDVKDKLLFVTAVMLSACGTFDYRKLAVLLHVYQQTDIEQLRIRALVGWVMSIDSTMDKIYPEQKLMVSGVISDLRVQEDLFALQLQIIYCLNAMSDNKAIKDDILPDLVKGQGMPNIDIRIIEDPDEIDDFIAREENEEKLEALQDKVERMMDMQKNGADIYFGGFAMMKNFPFFNTLSNWFCPFYYEHPELRDIYKGDANINVVKSLMNAVPFCDSDKYSFALAMNTVIAKIPKNMLDMLGNGELKSLEDFAQLPEDTVFLRNYLQDLFRFYRLCPMNKKFQNIFASEKALFITSELFAGSDFAQKTTKIAEILLDKHLNEQFVFLAKNCTTMSQKLLGMIGNYYMSIEEFDIAMDMFERLYDEEPDSKTAIKGLAKCHFHFCEYQNALEMYLKLEELSPESRVVQQNKYVCMSYVGREEEAVQGLAKLNYENPGNHAILSALGWAYLVCGKKDLALKRYAESVEVEGATIVENFHYGLACACVGDIKTAVEQLSMYFENGTPISYIVDIIKSESETIADKYGFSTARQVLIAELIRSLNGKVSG